MLLIYLTLSFVKHNKKHRNKEIKSLGATSSSITTNGMLVASGLALICLVTVIMICYLPRASP